MRDHYYLLRCGGELGFLAIDEGEPYYLCDLCEERGYLFLKSWVDDEDLDRDSEFFKMLPTTFTFNDETFTVCGLIPNAKDGNRWLNDLLTEARRRDAERERISQASETVANSATLQT